jgi:hypothetical protein
MMQVLREHQAEGQLEGQLLEHRTAQIWLHVAARESLACGLVLMMLMQATTDWAFQKKLVAELRGLAAEVWQQGAAALTAAQFKAVLAGAVQMALDQFSEDGGRVLLAKEGSPIVMSWLCQALLYLLRCGCRQQGQQAALGQLWAALVLANADYARLVRLVLRLEGGGEPDASVCLLACTLAELALVTLGPQHASVARFALQGEAASAAILAMHRWCLSCWVGGRPAGFSGLPGAWGLLLQRVCICHLCICAPSPCTPAATTPTHPSLQADHTPAGPASSKALQQALFAASCVARLLANATAVRPEVQQLLLARAPSRQCRAPQAGVPRFGSTLELLLLTAVEFPGLRAALMPLVVEALVLLPSTAGGADQLLKLVAHSPRVGAWPGAK